MYLPALSDRELLAHFLATRDPLTTTDLEAEIGKRFEALIEPDELHDVMGAIADELGIETACTAQALRDALSDHYIYSPESLREKLARADKFHDIAADAGDVISRLNDLINTTN